MPFGFFDPDEQNQILDFINNFRDQYQNQDILSKPTTINQPPDWISHPISSAWNWMTTPFDWAKEGSTPNLAFSGNPIPVPGIPLTVGNAWDITKATVGSPGSALLTAASLGESAAPEIAAKLGLSSLASGLPKIAGPINKAVNIGLSTIQGSEAAKEAKKGNYLGAAGHAGLALLGYGAMAPKGNVAPKAPPEDLEDFVATNLTPRTKDVLQRQGYTIGDSLPIDPQTGVSPGVRIIGTKKSLDPNFNQGMGDAELAGSTPYGQNVNVVTFKNPAKNVDQALQNWIGDRQAIDTEALINWKKFESLSDVSPVDYQAGKVAPELKDKVDELSKYFADKYSELRNSGIKFGFKENYLPQIWDNDPQEVIDALGTPGRVSRNPKFSFESVVKDYEEGIKAGLTPKYDNVADLAQWYERTANRAIADNSLLDYLKQNKFMSADKKPGYVEVSPESFPIRNITTKDGQRIQGVWYAPKEIADKIENYMSNPATEGGMSGALDKTARVSSTLKNFAMSSGPVPGSAINFHAVNETIMNGLTDPESPIKGVLTGMKYMTNPGAAQKSLEDKLATIPFWQRFGLQVGIEDVPFKGQEDSFFTQLKNAVGAENVGPIAKTKEVLNVAYENPLFQKMVPALKVERAEQYYNIFRNQGMSVEDAAVNASRFTNEAFGGLNLDRMFRDKDFQNLARTVGLAPDWLESGARMVAGMGKALIDPSNPANTGYLNTAKNLSAAYITANITNYALTGHYMYENSPGHKLMIELPGTENVAGKQKQRYIPIFGTTLSGLQIPAQIAQGIYNKDSKEVAAPFANRVSPPAQLLQHFLLTGENSFGQKLWDPKSTPFKNAGRVGNEFVGLLPPASRIPLDLITGVPPEEAIVRDLELPLRYGTTQKKKVRAPRGFDY